MREVVEEEGEEEEALEAIAHRDPAPVEHGETWGRGRGRGRGRRGGEGEGEEEEGRGGGGGSI